MRSAGQSLIPYMRHSRQLPNNFTFASFDVTSDGCEVAFRTHVSITGEPEAPLSDAAVQRLVSLAIVQALDGEELESAYEHLLDAYRWWATPPKIMELPDASAVVHRPRVSMVIGKGVDLSEA